MKRLVAWMGLTALMALGCGHYVDGDAQADSPAGDPAFFFAGDVPVYGQTVSTNDKVALAYLRAIRRIDPCGFADREAFAKIGEITSVGTLYALDECDVEIKMPGTVAGRFVSLQVLLARVADFPAFRADDVPVYETAKGSCEYLIPIGLAQLPGAAPLRKPDQPYLRVGLVGAQDCGVATKVAGAIAERLAAGLPARDTAAVYPTPLADRDPCEVLAPLAGEVDHWDINHSRPYGCEFALWRDGFPEVVSMRVALEPKIVEISTNDKQHRTAGGTDVYLDPTFCSAVAFVGPPMQRRLSGGEFVAVANVEVRPAVVVDSGEDGCANSEAVVDVAAKAAKLYG